MQNVTTVKANPNWENTVYKVLPRVNREDEKFINVMEVF